MSNDIHRLAATYALDGVDRSDRHRFEEHLDHCDLCTTEVGEFRDVAVHLATAVAVRPSPELEGRLRAQVGTTPQQAPRPAPEGNQRAFALRPALAVAAILAVVLTAGLAVRDLAAERDRAREVAAVLVAADARSADLDGGGGSALRVAWSPQADAAVVVGEDVPRPGRGQVYQLWALSADGPHSAGVFDPAPDGRVERRLRLPAEPDDGWQVTVEPGGGSPRPSGTIAYDGS